MVEECTHSKQTGMQIISGSSNIGFLNGLFPRQANSVLCEQGIPPSRMFPISFRFWRNLRGSMGKVIIMVWSIHVFLD
ncbi:MAG: hypothetical protein CBC16_08390 [Verrucomicrobia bacterium TMED56]|nr:MAG: hypothetical protein CBC16_08390 [Verrucomicrobia bacterium TMED56]